MSGRRVRIYRNSKVEESDDVNIKVNIGERQGEMWCVDRSVDGKTLTFGDFHSGGLARRLFGGEVKCEWLTA